jgi:multiple sugar transport system ATP-binding protein
MAFLEINGLRKRFGALEILKSIDLTLERGGFLVLVGPSGCGKSKLLNTIAGLESISAGEIRVESQPINDLHPSKRDIAMVFQSYAPYPNMTVAENMAFGMEMRRVPKAERDRAVAAVAKTLQIEPLLSRRPSLLSGGQRQRVAMGRALVRQPRVFLFDEPLSNLDAKLRVDMRVEIKRLHQTTGSTIVYVTHDQIEAMTLATKNCGAEGWRVAAGRLSARDLQHACQSFVADFMGSPAMNLLEGKVARADGATEIVIDRHDHPPIVLKAPSSADPARLADGAKVIFGIRPEAVNDLESIDSNAKSIAQFDANVEIVEPAGADTCVVTRAAGKEMTARMRADTILRAGQSHTFALNLDKAVLFDPVTTRRICADDECRGKRRRSRHRLLHWRSHFRGGSGADGRENPDPGAWRMPEGQT